MNTIKHFWTLLNTFEHFWTLLNTIEHYWTQLNTVECYWTLLKTFQHYWTFSLVEISTQAVVTPWFFYEIASYTEFPGVKLRLMNPYYDSGFQLSLSPTCPLWGAQCAKIAIFGSFGHPWYFRLSIGNWYFKFVLWVI